MALAAEQAGAAAVRIEGIDNLRGPLARFGTIIGIIKRDLMTPVRISPFSTMMRWLAQLAIAPLMEIARQRPVAVEALLARAHSSPPSTGDGRLLIRGRWSRLPISKAGRDIIGTTMSGYTPRYAWRNRFALSQSVA